MARSHEKPSPAHDRLALTTEWESVVESANETRRRVGRLYRQVERRALADPVRAAGWAIGAGFVLGGGVVSKLTVRAARVAATIAVRALGAGFVARKLLELVPPLERGEHRWTSAT